MRIGLVAAVAGGLALAGCAYPYGYGYGGGYGYGYGPSYAPAYYAGGYGYSPAYVQPYRYAGGVYAGGGQWGHDGNWHGQPQNDWHGQPQNGWHGQSQHGWNGQPRPGAYQRSTQPAQRAASPQTRQFEHDLGFRPN